MTSSDSESSSPKTQPRKSISRELANLALDSPAAGSTRSSRRSVAGGRQLLKPKRRGRSVDGLGRDDSDTENMDDGGGMVPATKLAEVEKKCQDLTNQLRVC